MGDEADAAQAAYLADRQQRFAEVRAAVRAIFSATIGRLLHRILDRLSGGSRG